MRAGEIVKRVRLLFKEETLQRGPVDLNEIIREMRLLLHSEATQFAVFIRTELAAGLPQVMGDRVQLQQVLMNLMMNSIDAMKEVDGMRELTIQSQSDEDGQVLISVSDTGVGLPLQKAEKIFDAFFTTKTHGAGMGMGLRISRSIVESHRGPLCGLLTTLRAAQDFVSHYLPTARNATHLCRQIALSLLTALTPTSLSFESIGRNTSFASFEAVWCWPVPGMAGLEVPGQ